MNLIEQLGGYECALYEYKNTLLADDFPYVIKATGTKFTRPELGNELLEYRRQHNIFEVGDFVLRNDGFGNVLKVTSIEGEYANLVRRVDGESIWSWFKLVDIRHATDAEIKAGKRL